MSTSILYQIEIKEQLGEQWADFFEPLVIQNEPGGSTTLKGYLRDQVELHGILTKLCGLNLTLIAVNRLDSAPNSG